VRAALLVDPWANAAMPRERIQITRPPRFIAFILRR
jgi:hypothetical protein